MRQWDVYKTLLQTGMTVILLEYFNFLTKQWVVL